MKGQPRCYRALWLTALLFLAFRPCVGESDAQEGKSVRFGYSALSLSFLPHLIARDAGIYQRHGLDVELIQMAGPLQVAALAAGELDLGSALSPALFAAVRGLPVRGVMVTVSSPLFYIVSDPDIMRVEDLIGKRMAVDTIGGLQHIVAKLILKKKGVDPDKVSYFQTGSVSNSAAALSGKSVSAALLSIPSNVVMTQKAFRQLASSQEADVHYPPSGLIVHFSRLQKDRVRIKRVIAAILDSISFIHERREWAAGYIGRTWKIDPKLADEAYHLALPTLPLNGRVSPADLQEFLDIAYENKQIQRKAESRAVMDYSLLDEVLKERGK